jgi:hypothetical protein
MEVPEATLRLLAAAAGAHLEGLVQQMARMHGARGNPGRNISGMVTSRQVGRGGGSEGARSSLPRLLPPPSPPTHTLPATPAPACLLPAPHRTLPGPFPLSQQRRPPASHVSLACIAAPAAPPLPPAHPPGRRPPDPPPPPAQVSNELALLRKRHKDEEDARRRSQAEERERELTCAAPGTTAGPTCRACPPARLGVAAAQPHLALLARPHQPAASSKGTPLWAACCRGVCVAPTRWRDAGTALGSC